MTDRLKDKVVVITGAASGIGAGTAKLFHAQGACVVIADLQEGPGAALAQNLGSRARFIRADVTSESDVAACVDLAVSAFGGLDVMVNNAGIIGAVGPIADTPLDDWNRTLAILLTGVFLGIKHAARVMIPRRRGSILSVASTAGLMGGLGPHAYTAAKHGVVGLTKSAASELAQYGVRVNAVAPGNTVTAMTASLLTGDPSDHEGTRQRIAAGSPLGIAGAPEDPAYGLLYLACDEARFVTGHTLLVDAGQTTGGTIPAFHNGEVRLIGAPTAS
ncbi:glucose 1-dehydrogenase [Phenylobacterium sp.]|uniref:glucose 1-dehydrogenase n=1 Tax=Phenylobacterium sp. TaxID=1871053 RepID=UPI00286C2577|nr:glucose 1-dehydrogenase [Phenylobacterium sp.]